MAHRRPPRARDGARPPDDERHANQRLEQRLAVPPQVPRRHLEQPLGVRPGPSRQRPLGPGDDRQATDRPPVELLGAKRMRLEPGVLAVVAGEDDNRRVAHQREQRPEPRVKARDRALVGVASVPAVVEARGIAPRHVDVPDVKDGQIGPLGHLELRHAGQRPRPELGVHRAVARLAVLDVLEAAEGADRLKQRPGDGAPRGVAGGGQPLGDRRHRLGEAGATQAADAVRRRVPASEHRRERRRRRRAGRVAGRERRALLDQPRRHRPLVTRSASLSARRQSTMTQRTFTGRPPIASRDQPRSRPTSS